MHTLADPILGSYHIPNVLRAILPFFRHMRGCVLLNEWGVVVIRMEGCRQGYPAELVHASGSGSNCLPARKWS